MVPLAATLGTEFAVPPESLHYTSNLSVDRSFAGKLDDVKLRAQLETAAAQHFESTTGIHARVSVTAEHTRRLEDLLDAYWMEEGTRRLEEGTAGLIFTYVVMCGSQCTQISSYLHALARNEACTCGLSSGNAYSSTLCNDAAGNACALIDHILPEPGGCVSYSGDCQYQQGMAISRKASHRVLRRSSLVTVKPHALLLHFAPFVLIAYSHRACQLFPNQT